MKEGELTAAEALWPLIPDNSLTILDRGYLSFWLFHCFQRTPPSGNKHFRVRNKSNITFTKIKASDQAMYSWILLRARNCAASTAKYQKPCALAWSPFK